MNDEACEIYCREILRFRKALNLTSISDEDALMRRFIQPSLQLAAWIPESSRRLLDIGSGMGVPGIPILIRLPALHGVLVERRKKRAEFLRHIVRKLKLNATVYDADINDLPHLDIDVCVARAVTRQDMLLNMCSRHAREGAVAVLPVPRDSEPAHCAGWRLQREAAIVAGDAQLIRCYHYSRGDNRGGFT